MSKADKMLQECGFEKRSDSLYCMASVSGVNLLFNDLDRSYALTIGGIVSPIKHALHLAIHEKLKEMRWI